APQVCRALEQLGGHPLPAQRVPGRRRSVSKGACHRRSLRAGEGQPRPRRATRRDRPRRGLGRGSRGCPRFARLHCVVSGSHAFALGAILLLMPGDSTAPSAAHRKEWEAWRAQRLERLRREDGWLSLVGLFWLQEGENSFGGDPTNRVVLPAGKVAGRIGSIILSKDSVSVRAEPGSGLTADGKPVTSMPLATDADGARPTVLKSGPISFYVIARGSKLGIRVKDSEAETRKNFRGIETFPYEEKYRVEARFEPYDPPRRIPVPNVLGTVETQPSPGALVFELGGKTYRLDPVLETGETDLFVIFGDQTNGHE